MNLSGFPSLQNATVFDTGQTAISVVNTQPVTMLRGNLNLLNSTQVDSILIALDGNGLVAGTVDLSGQTPPAPPSAVGMARALSLIAKAWTVTLDPSIFIFDDGSGGFWQLIVDASGNVGTQSTVGPATSDVILADGVGGFWKVVVDIAGNRGTTPDAGPATLVPALDDGAGVFWKLIVDATGNLGAQQIVPIAWAPAAETVTWIDTNGTFAGDLATFRSTADFATVTSLVFGATGNLTSLTGIQELPVLATLDCNTNALTSLDCTNCTALTTLTCKSNASLTALVIAGCASLSVIDCSDCNITGVIDVSPCAASLTNLATYDNVNLTGVTLTGCSSLSYWDTGNAAITAVNLTDCTALGTLLIEQNSLSNLDISPCLALTNLAAWGNPSMTSIILTGLISLSIIDVHACNITGNFNPSPCTALSILDCSSNANLTGITLTGLSLLAQIGCDSCNITGVLDVSPCAASVNSLTCYSNPNLSGITITACGLLTTIDCHSCGMNQVAVDNVLCVTDANGAINGSLDITSNTAPSAAGLVCSGNLDPGKGWTVTHD